MNKIFNILFLLALSFGAAQTLNAQGSQDDNFVLRITGANGTVLEYSQIDCQINGTADWAGSVDGEFCAELVWAYDVSPDSICCDTITNNYAGKIVALSRGVCEFGRKGLYAQYAGAIAVIVFNHNLTGTEDACTRLNMGAGVFGAQVTIPMVFGSRTVRDQVAPLINAGGAQACFVLPRMASPTAASMYATPLSQVAPMQAMTVVYNNRTGATENNLTLKAEVIDPSGALNGSVSYVMPVVEPGVDSFVVFEPYNAPAMKGKWTVRYTNSLHTESLDTVYTYFEHTDYTFATDNLSIDAGGVGPTDADFQTNGFYIQSGGLTLMGSAPAKATYATFGVANVSAVYVPGDPTANIIGVAVYKADVDGDGIGDLGSSFIDDLGAGLISYNEYVMTGNEANDQLIHVPLTDINTGAAGVDLEADNAYYVSLIYDGTAAGLGVCPRFSNSTDVAYASFTGYPTTPLYFGSLFTGGWNGAMVIQRLQLEGFDPTIKTTEPNTLADSKLNITPNPATEFVNLELKLDAVNPSVAVSILDAQGRKVVATQVEKNIQNGVMKFNVNTLPSGTYFMWVRTAEGSTMKKVSVCH